MDEKDFDLLLALAETANITQASKQLYISQSALSKRLKKLEEDLQARLVIRSNQGIRFTSAGEAVLASVRKITKELEIMRSRLDFTKEIISGQLKLGSSLNFSFYKLPQVLMQFRMRYPQVTVQVKSDHSRQLYQELLAGHLDLAIIRGEYPWSGHKVCLAQEKICAIKSQANHFIPFQDLPYIGRETDLAFQQAARQWLHEQGWENLTPSFQVDNLTTCVELVKADSGWAIVPEICLDDFNGDCIPLSFADGQAFKRPTYLMYNPAVLALNQVKAFINFVEEASQLTDHHQGVSHHE
ncbi:hypothetical protein AWM75_01305 [Aerococcus urinaehominis]|uniref:Uncharacterized protein n=1 Tax=Aerococcus urinaehominis TaxID=128944 RepID=A0A0X8FK11_9LACT|nr:LysR family transcriptional regulator [Aerococcus urinaehominis]AMB98714.1 hypothetical protein AWM75_01305 [Aerococcus urinaehominis]SDL99790.1 DNA-binding transcriptional regulator, LysR family [Aerococcus urinaehominis]